MRSRAVKPRCSKSLSLGFPEVMPKTARHAGCLFQGKAGFCAVRLWLPSSHYPLHCALLPAAWESYALIGLLTPLGLPRLARYYVYFNLANYAYYAF